MRIAPCAAVVQSCLIEGLPPQVLLCSCVAVFLCCCVPGMLCSWDAGFTWVLGCWAGTRHCANGTIIPSWDMNNGWAFVLSFVNSLTRGNIRSVWCERHHPIVGLTQRVSHRSPVYFKMVPNLDFAVGSRDLSRRFNVPTTFSPQVRLQELRQQHGVLRRTPMVLSTQMMSQCGVVAWLPRFIYEGD